MSQSRSGVASSARVRRSAPYTLCVPQDSKNHWFKPNNHCGTFWSLHYKTNSTFLSRVEGSWPSGHPRPSGSFGVNPSVRPFTTGPAGWTGSLLARFTTDDSTVRRRYHRRHHPPGRRATGDFEASGPVRRSGSLRRAFGSCGVRRKHGMARRGERI